MSPRVDTREAEEFELPPLRPGRGDPTTDDDFDREIEDTVRLLNGEGNMHEHDDADEQHELDKPCGSADMINSGDGEEITGKSSDIQALIARVSQVSTKHSFSPASYRG